MGHPQVSDLIFGTGAPLLADFARSGIRWLSDSIDVYHFFA
jgi:hypothetical protein